MYKLKQKHLLDNNNDEYHFKSGRSGKIKIPVINLTKFIEIIVNLVYL